METTTQFLDQIKARYGLPSDYALAAKLGITQSGVSSYRVGRSKLGDDGGQLIDQQHSGNTHHDAASGRNIQLDALWTEFEFHSMLSHR